MERTTGLGNGQRTSGHQVAHAGNARGCARRHPRYPSILTSGDETIVALRASSLAGGTILRDSLGRRETRASRGQRETGTFALTSEIPQLILE